MMETLSYTTLQAICLVYWMYSHTNTVESTLNHFETQFSHFEAETDKKVKDELTYLDKKSPDVIGCSARCASNKSCMSASFNPNEKLCKLSGFRVKGQNNQQRVISNSSWMMLAKEGCSDGWEEIGDMCYFYNDRVLNYSDAENACIEKGGKLAEPPTSLAFELLRNYTINFGGFAYWFGLNDIEDEGRYVWTSTGEVPEYTAWWADEPNEGRDGNCMTLYSGYGFRWTDTACFYEHASLCEN